MITINNYEFNEYWNWESIENNGTPNIYYGSDKFFIDVDSNEANMTISGYIKGSNLNEVEEMVNLVKSYIFTVPDDSDWVIININGYEYYGFPISFESYDIKPYLKKIKVVYRLKDEKHRMFVLSGNNILKFSYFQYSNPTYE